MRKKLFPLFITLPLFIYPFIIFAQDPFDKIIYLPLIMKHTISTTPIPNTVTILDNHSTWQQGDLERTSTHLYGEILNTTSDYIKPSGVTINFYNDQGTKLETINSTAFNRWFNVLSPGQKSCFYIYRGFYHDSEVWASYDFEPVQYEITNKRPPEISIIRIYTTTEYAGFTIHLDLQIDSGTLDKESWWAKAALYDDNKVISCQEIEYTIGSVAAAGNVQTKITYSNRSGQFPDQNINPFNPTKFRLEFPGGRGIRW